MRKHCFAQRTQRAQRKALRGWGFGMIGGGFIWWAGPGRGQATGSRAGRVAERAGGRGRVRRWGGSEGAVRGCSRRATASSGEWGKWFGLVRVGPPKWVRSVTRGGGV